MPNNFRHIALINLILPNAKIIDARRDALSCCFSGYKQLFGEGQQFSYDLENIGNYYRNYVEIMDHWDKALPGKILRVQYEDVVADLDTQVRRYWTTVVCLLNRPVLIFTLINVLFVHQALSRCANLFIKAVWNNGATMNHI